MTDEPILYLFDDNFPLTYKDAPIDCEGCPAPCCKQFNIPLTPRESKCMPMDPVALANGIAYLEKGENHMCGYHQNGKCSIWDIRPIVCREYSCIGDERITDGKYCVRQGETK